jgi:hypothetical protein
MRGVHKIAAIYAVFVGGDTKRGDRLFAYTASNADPCINWLEFAQHTIHYKIWSVAWQPDAETWEVHPSK